MPIMGKPCGKGRTVIKDEGPIFRPLVDGFLEDLLLTPELEDLPFEIRKLDFVRNFLH
jgi:hypothetical protein